MPATIIAGAQWGDEGKGRVVDLMAAEADMVIRCQGGPNAGHTVVNDRGRFILHSVPSGIFSPRARCVIGAGTVVNPAGLVAEMAGLGDAGVDPERLLISERAHLILPYHRLFDRLEEVRLGSKRIGSTGQGIAPAYSDKAARCGIRAGDLLDPTAFRRRLAEVLEWKNRVLTSLYDHPPIAAEEVLAEVEPAAAFLAPFIGDTVGPVHEALTTGKRLLLEGQLGVMRDLDWGAYPFVTSSSPTPAGMAAGAGVPPQHVDRIIGVVKAYTTAVGAGPFPTELTGPEGDRLRERGGEYGATTGRPRRCGWFDAVAVAWAARVAGFTELALTKVDVLDGEARIPVCVGYRDGDREIASPPATALMDRVQPVYEEFPGWEGPTSAARTVAALPRAARAYIAEVERRSGVPITLVSVGPERESAIPWASGPEHGR
ncbi:MAG: adenylosuccinate synthase [Armatimonadetes bacterium]|nr:adenylosuccinate synthase [Armatimonadota bacterium]